MPILRILALGDTEKPQKAFEEHIEYPLELNIRRIQRKLQKFIKRNGVPHHFRIQALVNGGTGEIFGANGEVLEPVYSKNGVNIFPSTPTFRGRRHARETAIAFATSRDREARKITVTPGGRVHESFILTEA